MKFLRKLFSEFVSWARNLIRPAKVNVAPGFFFKFVRDTGGADMLEYVLVLTFVALACVAGVTKLGSSISAALNTTANTITNTL